MKTNYSRRVFIALLAAVPLVPRGIAVADQATPDNGEFASRGLGLAIGEWEAIYGPLQPAQLSMMMELPNGDIGVRTTADRIDTIARYWNDDSYAAVRDAFAEMHSYLPADAVYVETFNADLALDRPVLIEQYRSDSLKQRYLGSESAATGSISIVYTFPSLMESDTVKMAMVVAGFTLQ